MGWSQACLKNLPLTAATCPICARFRAEKFSESEQKQGAHIVRPPVIFK